MTLVDQIMFINPQITPADFLTNVIVKDMSDGKGPFIAAWNFDFPQPSVDTLAKASPPLEDIEKTVIDSVQKRLDDFAQTRNYIGIVSACTYVNSTVAKFQAEGTYCLKSRDAHWGLCYQILADVQAGVRPLPSVDEVLKEMPDLIWPT